jgi:hypothetical protein
MPLLFNFLAWFVVTFAPGTTLEEAVAQTPPHLQGYPYYWTVEIEGNRNISGAIFADSDTDWQAKYDETWKRVDEMYTRLGMTPNRPLPYQKGLLGSP